MPEMSDILAVVLGGGRGSRLYPLTKMRSKPAVPLGGKYRLIDILLCNCINSGIYRVDVLTQFNSHSLHRHINQTYNFDKFHSGFVDILAGDHLYRMDYAPMAEFHWSNKADITVAVQPVGRAEASALGILKRGEGDRITDFVEKPKEPAVLDQFVSRDDPERPFICSMGIYFFSTDTLIDLLQGNPHFDDFGGDIIPYAI